MPGASVKQKRTLGNRPDDLRYIGRPTTRKAAIACTAPNTTSAAAALNFTQRTLISLPFNAIRWRVKWRNKQLRSATIPTTPCTITGIWTGAPARDTATNSSNRWNGNTSDVPAQVQATALTVPTDGTWVYSDWISTLSPILKGVEKVISWGITSTATGTGIASGNGYQGVSFAGASSAGSQTLSGATISASALYLDMVIEYEFTEAVRSVLFVGDSNTVGYNPAGPPLIAVNASPSSLPTESWPALIGQLTGCAPTNLGVGSATTAEFASTYPQLWDRIPAGATFDAAVVSLGTNGLTAGYADFITQFMAINTYLRGTLGIQNIYWTTITPRGYRDGAYTSGGTKIAGYLTADAAPAATTITASFPATTAQSCTIGLGPNAESFTVNASTGSGPYTWTLSGALANQHYASEPICQTDERTRRLINNFLRQLPGGILGCYDFEAALEDKSVLGLFTCDPRYAASDYLHFQRGANIIKATLAAGVGGRPVLV